jgi:organic radical activating enzyme
MAMITAIDNKRKTPYFQTTWCMGIRCNYDCSYCPTFRHSLTQPFQSLDTLKRTVDFIREYLDLQIKYTDPEYMNDYDLNLTGGEPTAHPHILDVIEYMREQIPYLKISLTTNGFFSDHMLETLSSTYIRDFAFSYHAEANAKQKLQVMTNIKKCHDLVSNDGYCVEQVSVNVMMHEDPDLFAECQAVIVELEAYGVEVRPRTIDRDDNVQAKERTETKIKNSRFGPASGKEYSDQQLREVKKIYIRKYQVDSKQDLKTEEWNENKKAKQVNGRPCCGGVTMSTLDETTGKWSDTKLIFNRNFKDWYCLVNLHWLYIEQDDDEIFTHQTCKANFANEKGPVGKISEYEKYIEFLRKYYEKGQLPVISCPNSKCTCGICTPKSNSKKPTYKFFKRHLPSIEPIF